MSSYNFVPLAPLFYLMLVAIFVVAVVFVEIGVFEYTAERMGIGRREVFALLTLSLLGGYVNIPIAQLPPERVYSGTVVNFFGVSYVVPTVDELPGTVLALNLGGAVIPAIVSLYLIRKNQLYLRGVLATALVATCAHALATPVKGVGIAMPILTVPAFAAVVAIVLSQHRAAPLAYISGTLGTLIGADLMNLGKIQGLGAPVASIGGAGTFDGVFLSGVLAVLLTSDIFTSGNLGGTEEASRRGGRSEVG